MFRHIVLLELLESATDTDRDAILTRLRQLPESIGAIREYAVGPDAGLAADNAHIGVVADFEDVAGYEIYRDHPAHKALISEHIKPLLASRTAVQMQL